MSDRLPPHSIEAERGVLGCILLAPECLDECQEQITPGAFYDLPHRKIYETLVALRNEAVAIDVLTLQQRLKDSNALSAVGGIEFLSTLPDKVPSAGNLPSYLAIVREKHHLRRLVKTCARAIEKVYADDGDATALLGQIQSGFLGMDCDNSATLDGRECAQRMTDELERRYMLNHSEGGPKRSGLVTGFADFDHMTDGLQFGEQTILAARPSIGKSAFALNVVHRVCITDNIPTAFITLEMTAESLMKRMLSNHAHISMGSLRDGSFTEREFSKFTAFSTMLRSRPIHIVDGVRGMTIDQIIGAGRRLWRKHGIKLFVIDYLQTISPSERQEKRTYEVGAISKALKALAIETKAAMLTIAALNRESEKDKQAGGRMPRLSDLAQSGQIEFDADTVALLHRDRDPEKAGQAVLFIAKQRDGELGTIPLHFNGQFCRFENAARVQPES